MKQTEIGLIPDDWEVKSLGDIYNFQYGDGNTNPNNKLGDKSAADNKELNQESTR